MPSQKNIDQLQAIKDRVSKAKSIIFTDYSGLSVGEQSELRGKVKELGGEIMVTKNTLLNLALKTELEGPTAVLFCFEDEVAPLKTLVEFAQDHEKPILKSGFLGERELSKEEVEDLSRLPRMNELLVRLMGQIQGPMYGMVTVLGGNTGKLVVALKAIGNNKSKD